MAKKVLIIGTTQEIDVVVVNEAGVVQDLSGTGIDVTTGSSSIKVQFVSKKIIPKPYKSYTISSFDLLNGILRFRQLATDFTSPQIQQGDIYVWAYMVLGNADIRESLPTVMNVKKNPATKIGIV